MTAEEALALIRAYQDGPRARTPVGESAKLATLMGRLRAGLKDWEGLGRLLSLRSEHLYLLLESVRRKAVAGVPKAARRRVDDADRPAPCEQGGVPSDGRSTRYRQVD